MVEIRMAVHADMQKRLIEGPSRRQALRMAAYRERLLAQGRAAQAAGDNGTAFDRHCEAWDVEIDLRRYGFHPVTGRPAPTRRRPEHHRTGRRHG